MPQWYFSINPVVVKEKSASLLYVVFLVLLVALSSSSNKLKYPTAKQNPSSRGIKMNTERARLNYELNGIINLFIYNS